MGFLGIENEYTRADLGEGHGDNGPKTFSKAAPPQKKNDDNDDNITTTTKIQIYC